MSQKESRLDQLIQTPSEVSPTGIVSAATPNLDELQRMSLLLRAIIESSDDAIVSKNLNGIVTSWNIAAEKMFGYTAEEMVGRSITTIIPEEYLADESVILAKIRSGQRIEHFETVRRRKNGELVHVSLSISPIRDNHGNIVGAAKIARDISQQKHALEAAFRLAALVESSDDAIISKDLNGTITSWNPAAERILGYTAEEAIGKNITLIIPPELHSDEPVILGKIRAGERIEHFQTVRVNKRGERLNVSLTVSPVRNQGKVIGAAKILRDITKEKRIEAALRTSERLASVGRLAATIAHEINNPLEAVTNFIYLARQTPDLPETVKEYLKVADHELARVAHVAQQTLGFYRDNTKPITVSVSKAVEDVLTIYGRKLKYKDLNIETRIPKDLSIRTLQGQLKQVLLNLLANAIDASKQNGKIIVSAHMSRCIRKGKMLVLSVADTGSGIAPSARPRVFEPFFTTKKDVGTGLGLWITRDLLERKGGHIRYRSRTGTYSGTVMTIFMPLEAEVPASFSAA